MVQTDDGLGLIPELYAVTADCVAAEYKRPGSQHRVAVGRCPFLWAQSLYILGKLLQEVIKMIIYWSKLTFNVYLGVPGCWRAGSIEQTSLLGEKA
jgi:hypothetical protein